MMLQGFRNVLKKLFVAGLLLACFGVHALELTGRWDRTFTDANDEAAVVAVVLCIGVGLAAAGTLLKTIRFSRIPFRLFIAAPTTIVCPTVMLRFEISFSAASPPLALRV